MPSSAKFYKDRDKLKAYKKRHKQKYYAKSRKDSYRSREQWSKEEIDLILYSVMTDTELSKELHRSVQAIQVKRCREIKKLNMPC